MTKQFLIFILGLMLVSPALAQDDDNNFENTSEGIIQRLLPEEDEAPAQSGMSEPSSGEWEKAFDSKSGENLQPAAPSRGGSEFKQVEEVKTRSMKVLRMQGQKEVWTTIVSPEKRTGQYINIAIEFDVASHTIRRSSIPLLNELGRALSDPRLKDQKVYVNGHTDSDGSEDMNLRLSFRRADAVKWYLVDNCSISPERLMVQGYGEGMPLVPNTSARNKQMNRRVEIVATQEAF